MNNLANILLSIENEEFTYSELVSILVLIDSKINIDTISEMSRTENKTPRGIRISNQYMKVKIGSQLMAVKGLRENNLPF
tara:strand:+ start:335 stop:574 length:240 start_codon:yes stop_codon:yes gene_type:complete